MELNPPSSLPRKAQASPAGLARIRNLPFRADYWMPDDLDPALASELKHHELARVLKDIWPNTPQPFWTLGAPVNGTY